MLTYVFGFSGEIPVALLRWKFVENRTVKLTGNAGLQLPSNIGELGDSVTKIDLSDHNLRGELSIRSERFNGSCSVVTSCAGELPVEIIRMKAKGVEVSLSGNAGFTLPSNIGELGDDITKLDLSNCSLTGPRSTRTELYQNTCLFYSLPHRPYPCRAFRLGQFKGAETLPQQVDR